jgi:hypothetical protein
MNKMVWNGDELIEWEMDINSPVYQNMRKWFGELIAKEIENAVIEVVGNSAATMQQAAKIARGNK